jgi:predicted DNA-binding protein (MmcQ/YjbR family)
MDFEQYCLQKSGATENYPFGPEVCVFKVGGKVFALTRPPGKATSINLKCDPERSIILRQQYPGIIPGYHMNKRHWNTIKFDGTVPDDLIMQLIDHSFELVAPPPKRISKD